MIDGITILKQTEILLPMFPEGSIGNVLLTALMIGIMIIFALIATILIADEYSIIAGILCGAIAVSSPLLMPIIINSTKVDPGKYEYEVLISDEVNIKEVYDKYEIISKDGEVFTIRDKID